MNQPAPQPEADPRLAAVPPRPPLILPEVEAAALEEALAGARVVLEYGMGGSTAVAAELPGKTLFSVESDPAWLAMMVRYFDATPPVAAVHLHHGDIGPVENWGYPLDDSHRHLWQDYAATVWDRDDFQHPDLVLIDGRFRVGCFLAVAARVTRPVTVLFDDYADRPDYHGVERLVPPVALHGRMARFELRGPLHPGPDLADWTREAALRPL